MKNVLDTDTGIITIALEVYAEYVKKHGGSLEFQAKILDLSNIYRNYCEEELDSSE